MFLFKSVTFYFVCVVIVAVTCIDETSVSGYEDELSKTETSDLDIVELIKMLHPHPQKKVNVKLYYESLCPYCRDFSQHLKIYTVELHEYIDLQLYPYGNAETRASHSNYIFDCQHGEEECYGNKLHACAIDILGNITQAVIYTSCMMDPARKYDYGSNDAAADECAEQLSMNAEPIKSCAKSKKGSQLLKYYGDETDKANIDGVPHVLIDGIQSDYVNFPKDINDAIGFEMNSSRLLHTEYIYLPIAFFTMVSIVIPISLSSDVQEH